MDRFLFNLGLCPADKPPPQLISVSLPHKKPSWSWSSPHKASSRLTELCWGCPPSLHPPCPAPPSAQGCKAGKHWEAISPLALFPGLPVPPGESRRIPGARSSPAGARTHLGHSLQVPAGNDGPAAVPAGKGRVRRAGLLTSTSGSPGVRLLLAGIAAAPSPRDADGESRRPGVPPEHP